MCKQKMLRTFSLHIVPKGRTLWKPQRLRRQDRAHRSLWVDLHWTTIDDWNAASPVRHAPGVGKFRSIDKEGYIAHNPTDNLTATSPRALSVPSLSRDIEKTICARVISKTITKSSASTLRIPTSRPESIFGNCRMTWGSRSACVRSYISTRGIGCF